MSRVAITQMRSSSFSASQLGAQLWLINRAGFHGTLPSKSCWSLSVKIYALFCSHRRNDSLLLILSPRYSRMRVPLRIAVFANPPVPWIGEHLNKTHSVSAAPGSSAMFEPPSLQSSVAKPGDVESMRPRSEEHTSE